MHFIHVDVCIGKNCAITLRYISAKRKENYLQNLSVTFRESRSVILEFSRS